jgi:signal transduction histidine kinase
MINLALIALSLAAFIIFAIIILILFKTPKEYWDKIFIFFNISLIAWIIADIFYGFQSKNILIWSQITYIVASFIPFIYLLFCDAFLSSKQKPKKKFLLSLPVIFIFFILFFFPELMIKKGQIGAKPGPVFYFYLFYMAFYFSFGSIILLKKIPAFSNTQKRQLKFILWGAIITSVLAVMGALVLPLFGIYSLYFFSPAFTLILAVFITYAIFKHGLFNIKIIATELLTFGIWIFLLFRVLIGQTWRDKIIDGILLTLVIIFGILLIRSVTREIKQRERLEKITKDLEEANARLRQLDEAKSEFLSIASHQLRTPLTSIKGLLSMLLEGFWGPLNEEQQKYISQVSQSGDRLLHLVEDLLDISRIEAGRMTFDFQPVDMEKLTEDIIKELEPQAAAKKLSVNFNNPPQPFPQAKADSFKIRQVIQNLIDNSIKYTEQGGAEINLKQEGNEIVFSITDTGRGVARNQQTYLFGKFQRGEGAAVQHTEGVGLGLYLADKIIKEHHGRIWIESDGENKGSTFCFTLPKA